MIFGLTILLITQYRRDVGLEYRCCVRQYIVLVTGAVIGMGADSVWKQPTVGLDDHGCGYFCDIGFMGNF